ncbi:hypothetical protein K458DRAFT_418505 [Lentithecium fluviatile CBS 122367]|uniref:Uncharacterized protein n=1 Tax=Lentithecium fluviatile CBS 122367 TaxID=1168545 RepID=A0A6G1J112_9PLEO|nr:hypothetical protein K458DRAFT_418505 [Lentithecium fluviatile CBS 122367]
MHINHAPELWERREWSTAGHRRAKRNILTDEAAALLVIFITLPERAEWVEILGYGYVRTPGALFPKHTVRRRQPRVP